MTRKRVQKHFTQKSMTEQGHAYHLHTPNLIRRYVQSGEALDTVNLRYGEQPNQNAMWEGHLKIVQMNQEFEALPPEEREKYETPQEWVSQKLYEASQAFNPDAGGETSGSDIPTADGGESPPKESLDDS